MPVSVTWGLASRSDPEGRTLYLGEGEQKSWMGTAVPFISYPWAGVKG